MTSPGKGSTSAGVLAGDELLDLREHRIDVPAEHDVIAVELSEPCPGDLAGQVLPHGERDGDVAAVVDDQGRDLDGRQNGTDIDPQVGFVEGANRARAGADALETSPKVTRARVGRQRRGEEVD